jgi:hypothetical protein
VLLNKLESGFLLLQTQQGSVVVQPSSFWQRVYLLWTFRNFRQLSPALLNARQTAFINHLFLEHAAAISYDYDPLLQIGVVEDFVPPAIEIGAALAVKTEAPPAVKAKLPEPTAAQSVAPPVLRDIAADVPPALQEETGPTEGTVFEPAEIPPRHLPGGSFAPILSWGIVSWLKRALSNLAASKPAAFRPQVSLILILMFAAALGPLSLSVFFIVAFHRTGAAPGSQAHPSPPRLHSPDSPTPPEPTSVAEAPATVPEVTLQADAVPDAPVEPAPVQTASPVTTTHRITTPQHASRGPAARVATRSSEGFHAAALSSVPASASTRRIASAPRSRAATARSAQHYFALADQQMHQGNYAAAAANYQRAWRIEQNRAAARGRLARARRAMLAEKESVASPQ